MRRALLPVVLLVAFSGCSGSEGPSVDMVGAQRFIPDEIDVAAGDTIEFANTSNEPHTVTAYSGSIRSEAGYFASGGFESEEEARANLSAGLIDPGETFELTLNEAGTYRYFCIPHESQDMRGTIEVLDEAVPDDE
jgi:plastocyanin